MILLQEITISVGLLGISYSIYRYLQRPSVYVIPAILTISALFIIVGESVPIIWLTIFGRTDYAVVTNVDCQPGRKHHIYYSFSIGGEVITSVGPDGYGNPTCSSIKVGDKGVITYIMNEPKINVWGKAPEYLLNRLAAIFITLIFFPMFSYYGVQKRIKNSPHG